MKACSTRLVYVLLLASFFFATYLLPLGVRDLLSPDETRYGEVPREMITSGDWVVPHFNGLRYFEKPPLGYWIHAGSQLLFGENSFAVRFPSALATGLSALLVFAMVRRMSSRAGDYDHHTDLVAAVIFLSCFEVYVIGGIALLDSLFSLFLTACILFFFWATEERPRCHREQMWLLCAGVACGLAFLTKGFLAFAVPILTLVPYLAWQRRYADLFRMSWLPIVVAVLVVLPWGIMIHMREPDFWRYFFWDEHIQRFIGEKAQHRESFWFFFMAAPGLFLPWTLLIPAAALAIRKHLILPDLRIRLLKLCLCWLLLTFLFFSISKGKLLTYILPCFPPFAVLMAYGLTGLLVKTTRKPLQYGIVTTGLLLSGLLLVLLFFQIAGYKNEPLFSQTWKAVMLAGGVLCMVVLVFWSLRVHHAEQRIFLIGVSPFLLFLLGQFATPDILLEQSAIGRLLEKYEQQISSHTVVMSCKDAVGAAAWVLKRDDVYILSTAGEFAYGLSYPDGGGRLLDTQSASRIIRENAGNVLLICRNKKINNLRKDLPVPVHSESSGTQGYDLLRY